MTWVILQTWVCCDLVGDLDLWGDPVTWVTFEEVSSCKRGFAVMTWVILQTWVCCDLVGDLDLGEIR